MYIGNRQHQHALYYARWQHAALRIPHFQKTFNPLTSETF